MVVSYYFFIFITTHDAIAIPKSNKITTTDNIWVKKLKLGISGGIALFPVNARNGPDLLRAADAALYKAKKYERGTFQVARGITGPLATHNIGGE